MLPKKFRLPLKQEFLRIKKSGRYLNGDLSTVLYSVSPPLTENRYAIIVGKNISKKATERNYLKRLIGEALLSLNPDIKKSYDVIIIAKPKILGKSLVEIKLELKEQFNNLVTRLPTRQV